MMMTQKALRGGDDDVERGEEEEGKATNTTTTIQMTKRQLAMASLAVTMQTTTGMMLTREEAKADSEILSNFWEQIDLPLDPGVILLDVAFTDEDAKHGFLLGTRQTILETFDGGKTWDAKDLGADLIDDDVNYRFNSVSFRGDEGWIVGKPAILLHTTDAGKTWERVGLSPRLVTRSLEGPCRSARQLSALGRTPWIRWKDRRCASGRCWIRMCPPL